MNAPARRATRDAADADRLGALAATGRFLRRFGPGIVTGAADDDPSGIATYAQAGAQFGTGMLWTLAITYPLMFAVQASCAAVGRATGHGLAANLRRVCPTWVLMPLVFALAAANTINMAADLAAMAEATRLLAPAPFWLLVVAFATVSLLGEVYVSYKTYSRALMISTASLLSYVLVVGWVDVPWGEVLRATLLPALPRSEEALAMVVAILGTTISPYLFFWQAANEVEEQDADPERRPLVEAPSQTPDALARIRIDTLVGMAASNLIAWFIMLTTSTALHAHGVRDIDSAAAAANALRPVAGRLAEAVFAVGILGTGLLSLPVLAGSAAYALGEALGFPVGLDRSTRRVPAFYGAIALCFTLAAGLALLPISPMKALVYAAVVNGMVSVPVLGLLMLVASNPGIMGRAVISPGVRAMGWLATLAMTAATGAMLLSTRR